MPSSGISCLLYYVHLACSQVSVSWIDLEFRGSITYYYEERNSIIKEELKVAAPRRLRTAQLRVGVARNMISRDGVYLECHRRTMIVLRPILPLK